MSKKIAQSIGGIGDMFIYNLLLKLQDNENFIVNMGGGITISKDNNQLTINPSYHTFTLENNDTEYNDVLDKQSQESIPNALVI